LDRLYQELAIQVARYERLEHDLDWLRAVGSAAKTIETVVEHQTQVKRKIKACVRRVLGDTAKAATPAPESILARLTGKTGLLRRFLLGQSTTYSGRSVIVPNPDLGPEEVGLPAAM